MISQITHRRYDFLSCIAFCFLFFLMWEPANLFSSGFILTFMAVVSIAVVVKKIEKIFAGLQKNEFKERNIHTVFKMRCIKDIGGLIGIQAGMAPLTVRYFHYMSPAVLIFNIPAVIIAGITVPLGIIMFVFWLLLNIPMVSFIGELFFMPVGSIIEMLVRILIWINHVVEGFPLSYIYTATPSLCVILIYYFCIFFFCSEAWTMLKEKLKNHISDNGHRTGMEKRRCLKEVVLKTALLSIISVSILSFGIWVASDWKYMTSKMIIPDQRIDNCVHLRNGSGREILLLGDCSYYGDIGKDILLPYFLGRGISTVDIVVMKDPDRVKDEIIKELREGIHIKKLVICDISGGIKENKTVGCIGFDEKNIIFLEKGDKIVAGNIKMYLEDIYDEKEMNKKAKDEKNTTAHEKKSGLVIENGTDRLFFDGTVYELSQ